MEKYKKTFYIYLIIICIQILVVLGLGLWEVFSGYGVTDVLDKFDSFTENIFFIAKIFVLCFLFSIVPVYISGKNLPWSHWLVSIVPVVFLIPVPYLWYDANTCTGKLCGVGPMVMIYVIFGVEIMYIVYYLVGKYLRKWDVSVSLFILKVFLVLYNLISLFILYNYSTVIRPYQKLEERVEQSDTLSTEEVVKLCEDPKSDNFLTSDCWVKAIKYRPGIDICSLAKDKTECLYLMSLIYHGGCKDIPREYLKDTEGKYKTDAKGNGLLDQSKMTELYQKCWTDSSKKYPGIDICLDAYNNKDEKCRLFLDSKK